MATAEADGHALVAQGPAACAAPREEIGLEYLVYLVYLVSGSTGLISFFEPDQPNKPNKPDQPLVH